MASFLYKGKIQSSIALGQYWADKMVQRQGLSYDMMLFNGFTYEGTWDTTYKGYPGPAAMGWWAENNCLAHLN